MKVSYEWLQSYFKERLPEPEVLTELFTFHLAEVESVEKVGEDTVFDIKILPDRACYALSVRGIARELSAILDRPLHEEDMPAFTVSAIADPDIRIMASDLCTKFVSRRIENLEVRESPEWLKRRLTAIGQRPINNLVDATNYLMFDIGRPMHAFDADKVKGAIVVRSAEQGEVVVTLDNKEVALNNGELVVADDEGVLGLAGIKGGKRGGVDATTKNIILESANWNPSYIRRTATTTGIRTDASKRFENRLSPFLAEESIERIVPLLLDIASTSDTKVGRSCTVSFEEVKERAFVVDPEEISRKLGISIEEEKTRDVLRRLSIPVEKQGNALLIHIPADRLDLEGPDDIVEEVGRIVGYDQIPLLLPPNPSIPVGAPTSFYWEWKVREVLFAKGFSEVMTSSFSDIGEVAIEKPLAKDKGFCRPNLRGSFGAALSANALRAPLFGSDTVCMFEIGKVFLKRGEHTSLAVGCAGPKRNADALLQGAIATLSSALGVSLEGETKEGVFECDLDGVTGKLSVPKEWDIHFPSPQSDTFVPFSRYPFIARDVALFVPEGTNAADIQESIRQEAGPLAFRVWKFDEFKKDGKQSFAFRIVFQSPERTLTDEEVGAMMERIYAALKNKFKAEIR